jgi:hypothetical protein
MNAIHRAASPEGVQHQSPGSRSAPGDKIPPLAPRTPTGFNTAQVYNPFGVDLVVFRVVPGVRCATPGFVVRLLRSQMIQHPGNERHPPRREPRRGSTSEPGVAQRTPGARTNPPHQPRRGCTFSRCRTCLQRANGQMRGRILGSQNSVSGFLEIFPTSLEDIGNVLLGIPVDQREPVALYVNHRPIALLKTKACW